MTKPYQVELVSTRSEDGFRLDGVLVQPFANPEREIAVLCIPGLYASFYDAPYPEIGRALARLGFTSLAVNTRGHDFGAVLRDESGRPAVGGGGWERLADSPLDVSPWVAFLTGLGYRGVILFGHSLGARKAVYYQSERRDPAVVGVVVGSGHAAPLDPPNPEVMDLACRMIADGRGRDLLPWPEVGCSMSAQTYLDHEDPDAPFRGVFRPNGERRGPPVVAGIHCPVLAFFGSQESGRDGRDRSDELETIRDSAVNAPRVDLGLIDGANHLYVGREPEVARLIVEWIDRLAEK